MNCSQILTSTVYIGDSTIGVQFVFHLYLMYKYACKVKKIKKNTIYT